MSNTTTIFLFLPDKVPQSNFNYFTTHGDSIFWLWPKYTALTHALKRAAPSD